MKKFKVYTGTDIEDMCGRQLHPLNEVKSAKATIDTYLKCHKECKGDTKTKAVVDYIFTNSPDFVAAIKEYGETNDLFVEFYLNGVSKGYDIEPIFEDFNRSFDEGQKLITQK